MAYLDGGITSLINEEASAEHGNGCCKINGYINQVTPVNVIDAISGLEVTQNQIVRRVEDFRIQRCGNMNSVALDHFLANRLESLAKDNGMIPLAYYNDLPPLDPNPS